MNAIGQVTVDFDVDLVKVGDKDIRAGLSAVVQVGDSLFLACDETSRIERVSRIGARHYGKHVIFELEELVGLPAAATKEVDIEGLAYDERYLWVVGSHSGRRSAPKKKDDGDKALERLRTVEFESNRFLLARIPVAFDGETPSLVPEVVRDEKLRFTSAKLHQTLGTSELTERIAEWKDPFLVDSLGIPGKDNGFDIEGLASVEGTLLLGLRGPVLRGYAAVIRVELRESSDGTRLELVAGGRPDTYYVTSFLPLAGLGVREICFDPVGKNLYVLAGPTMVLEAPVVVYRWSGADDKASTRVADASELVALGELRTVEEGERIFDHAEGIAFYEEAGERALIVAYDAPAPSRLTGEASVLLDLVQIAPSALP